MHSELHGAAVVIVKNPSGNPVPDLALNEAATFEMCHSPCWESKVTAQVYWVNANQVSKTPPTGMFIGTGSFIIRGKRNFLQPQKLELGFTVMFCISEESLANHIGERHLRGGEEATGDDSFLSLQRAESIQSSVTNEESEQVEEDGAPKEMSVIEKILKSAPSFGGSAIGNEDERITVVQVGEKARDYNPATAAAG